MKERNDEYKAFLEEKKMKDQHRFDHKKPPTAPVSQFPDYIDPKLFFVEIYNVIFM